MEQTPSLPGRSPELPSVSSPSTGETAGTFSNPETTTESLAERQEQHSSPVSGTEQTTIPPVVPPATITLAAPGDGVAATLPSNMSPTVASDDELIEKEWVDRAKKVIAETKDDPYRREQEVNRLQVAYLEKRYGRGGELGSL